MGKTGKIIFSCALAAAFGIGLMPLGAFTAEAAGDVAEVGGVRYADFTQAEAAWTDGATLKLLADVSASVELGAGTRTLDLGGFTLTAAEGRAVRITGGALTVKDSSANKTGAVTGGDAGGGNGGGIYAENATLTFESGSVKGNHARKGGGIYAVSSTVLLSGGAIAENEADYGGGAYFEGSTVTAALADVHDNTAVFEGGGLLLCGDTQKTQAALSGGTVRHNGAGTNGGGIMIWNNAELTLSGTAGISGNNAALGGAGVYLLGSAGGTEGAGYKSALTMNGGTIEDNVAESGFGGGIKLSANGVLTMNGGTITGNSAMAGGGGISAEFGSRAVFAQKPAVSENFTADEKNNIYLVKGCEVKIDDALDKDAILGFNMGMYGVISEGFGGNWSDLGGVTADETGYEVMLEGNDITLGSNVPREIAVSGAKTEYKEGDDFDQTGMVVKVTFLDGRTLEVDDYSVEGGIDLKMTTKYVTVVYTSKDVTLRSNYYLFVASATSGVTGGTADQGSSFESTFGFIAVITIASLFVIAFIVVGIVTDGFKGKKKRSE